MQSCKLDMTVLVYLGADNYLSACVVEAMRWAGSSAHRHLPFDVQLWSWADAAQRMLTHPAASLGVTPLGPAVFGADGTCAVYAVADPAAWEAAQ